MTAVFFYDAIRSPRTRAKACGGLHELTPSALLAQLYGALQARTGLDPGSVAEVILGCVTQYGEQAANIAKTSLLFAGWPAHIPGLTVHRFCSSSVDAIALAGLKIANGHGHTMVAGGVEMMSRVPLLADKARVFSDSAYGVAHQMLLMGSGADLIASRLGVTRAECDAVALLSQQRATIARREGYFRSIVPITTSAGAIAHDDCIRSNMTMELLAALPPAFTDIGRAGADAMQRKRFPALSEISHVHTAGNSPALCDGAGLVLLGDESAGGTLQQAPIARLLGSTTACGEPLEVVGGCIDATRKLLQMHGLSVDAIDVFEVHEAFAATTLKTQRELGIDDTRLNVNGGVIALGHPMGATGAMMTGTAIDELHRQGGRLAVVAASGAAGSGSALLIERC